MSKLIVLSSFSPSFATLLDDQAIFELDYGQ